MRIFVTGGSGLLGNSILRQLTGSQDEAIALVRSEVESPVFDDVEAAFVRGDLLDSAVISDAVRQSDAVIHSAGMIHLGWKRLEESLRVNRDGTRNVVEACLQHDRPLIHVGSVNTLAVGTRDEPSDEKTPLDHAGGQVPCSYVRSKRAGVEEVQRGVAEGLTARIIHPGFMLGPWDWKPSSGRMMVEVGRSWKPFAPAGGCSVCDSRDVAAATIAALRADVENGRQFILAGENCRYKTLWAEMAARMGARGPVMAAGPLVRWIGMAIGELNTLVREESDLNSAGVRMSSQYHWYDSARARSELGYQTRPLTETLDDAAQWLKIHHATGENGSKKAN